MTENNAPIPQSRERYFREREALVNASKRKDDIEKTEKIVLEYFTKLFYGNMEKKNFDRVREAFGAYSLPELQELYGKMKLLGSFMREDTSSKIMQLSTRGIVPFLVTFMGADAIAVFLASEFVWHLGANFMYVVYSEVFSVGILGIVYAIWKVIKIVREKE